MLTIITNPANFYHGRKVRILKTEQIGPNVWCKVELADAPGVTTQVRREHLAAWDLLVETRNLRDRLTRTQPRSQRLPILVRDVQLEEMFA